MDRTKSEITLGELGEQIRNSMVFNPWSYATIIAILFWLGPLPHGDMAVPIWHTMVKTGTFGHNSPHS